MRNLNVTLVRALSLSLLLAATVACEDGRDEIANVVPGPIIENQGGTNVGGGSAVGTDPTLVPPDSKEIPPPVEAPTIGAVPTPNANPPIISGDPAAVPTPTPFPTPTPTPIPDNVGTLECVTVTNGATLTLTATIPLGVQDVSDIVIRNLTRSPLTVEVDRGLIEPLNPANLTGQEELNVVFTVPFSPDTIRSFETGDTIVISLQITDTQGRVLVLEAPPCNTVIDDSQLPPPPPVPSNALVFDQVTLEARDLILTQTANTGVVGFGPISGPGAPTDNFNGPGSSATPPVPIPCGTNDQFFSNAGFPNLVVNEQNGAIINVNQGTLAPDSILRTPVRLAGQRLSVFVDQNGFLNLAISPGNFDELFRINYFEDQDVTFRLARCVVQQGQPGEGGAIPPQTFNLEFDEVVNTVRGVLESVQVLFTLRGTTGGIGEPNNGTLRGAQFDSDQPLEEGIVSTSDPRFSGVLNLLDVSSNQIRSDISFVVDQVRGQETQAALRELSIPPGDLNPVSGNPPFISINGCPATATNNLVCGRFQISQPFPSTNVNDVLIITGTFTGLISE
jgi:hypothetical protein